MCVRSQLFLHITVHSLLKHCRIYPHAQSREIVDCYGTGICYSSEMTLIPQKCSFFHLQLDHTNKALSPGKQEQDRLWIDVSDSHKYSRLYLCTLQNHFNPFKSFTCQKMCRLWCKAVGSNAILQFCACEHLLLHTNCKDFFFIDYFLTHENNL